jgi:hypothetical protein
MQIGYSLKQLTQPEKQQAIRTMRSMLEYSITKAFQVFPLDSAVSVEQRWRQIDRSINHAHDSLSVISELEFPHSWVAGVDRAMIKEANDNSDKEAALENANHYISQWERAMGVL